MKKGILFFLLVIATVLITRVSIFLIPEVDIKIFNIIVHHFWFGIFLLVIGLFITRENKKIKLIFYSIGTGLIIDEFIFILLGSGGDAQYWAVYSMVSVIALIIIVFYERKLITKYFMKKEI